MRDSYITHLARALYQASVGKKKDEIDRMVKRAISMLQAKNLSHRGSELASEIALEHLKETGAARAVITTKHPLSPNEAKAIVDRVAAALSCDVHADFVVDSSLLGGYRVRSGDMLLDATLDHSLVQLRNYLTTNRS